MNAKFIFYSAAYVGLLTEAYTSKQMSEQLKRVKSEWMKYEQGKYEWIKYESVKYDQRKYEWVKYEQVKCEWVKYESVKYDG